MQKMKKLVWFVLLIFIAYLLLFRGPYSDTDDQPTTQSTADSENDANQKAEMDMELKKFYEIKDSLYESSNSDYENLVKTLNNYIQRYISLFLITSDLVERPVKDPNEMITIDLEITLRGEDLTYLQGFSESAKESNSLKKLSKLDGIFSHIATLKKRSYMENAFKFSKSFFTDVIFRLLKNPFFNHYFPLIVIFTVTYLIYVLVYHKPFVTSVILLNSLIVWDSLNLYWKRIKEIDLDIYVKSMQFEKIPEICDPSSMGWYEQLYSFFGQNRCLQYIQNMNKNPVEEVSILMCLVDTYSTYLLRVPMKSLGASIRDFTGEIGELWPRPFRLLLSLPLSLIFTAFVLFFILVVCGKRLRLSFFGAAVELGDVKPAVTDKDKAAAATSAPAINGVRNLRKLKPWTRVGLPRLNKDSGALRKSLLKHLESSAVTPDDVKKNESHSDEKPNTENSNVQPNDNIIKQD